MTALHIHLLGSFEVLRDGHLLSVSEWRNQQTRAILKVLLTRQGRVVPADQLLDLLWPDTDPQTARRRLHVRISQLRRILDADDPSAHVLTVEGGYTFKPRANCWIDTLAFEACAQQGLRHQESGDLVSAVESYENARALYRGDLLEEDLYEDWTFTERERWREYFLTVLTELAECYARQGHYRRAIICCREVLTADPCRESVYVHLMLYHYYAGEQDQALRIYERCRQVLAEELGVEPLSQTTALYEQVLRRHVRPVEGAVCYPQPVYEARLFEVPYSLGRTPFVGREREYAWLIERLKQAAAGDGGVMSIAGEAGIGKTRLAEQALGYVREQGFLILSSRCYEAEVAVPYHPVMEALWPLVAGDSAFALETLSPEWVAELARLFPSLGRGFGSQPDVEGQQTHLFEAVFQLLAAAATAQPVVVFVDDVHWADTASLSLLAHLTHRTVSPSVAWLLTCRPEESLSGHPLWMLLDGLRRDGRLAELDLEPLGPDAVAALIAQASGGKGLDSALSERLALESGGNPFYLVSILQNLFEEGVLSVATDRSWTLSHDLVARASELMLPLTLRKTLQRRLSRLERSDRRVLEVAAVLGRRFDFDLLERTVDLDEEALLETLDRLAERRLLEERPSPGHLEYDFSHNKLREVTYLCTRAARRRWLHRRAALALVGLGGDAPETSAKLAYHYHRGGQPTEAIRFAILAGEQALQLYAVQQAINYFEDATKWAKETALSLDETQLVSLHINWADALRRGGRYDEALSHYVAALPLVRGERKHAVVYQICAVGAMRGGSLAEFGRLAPSLEQELADTGDTWALASLRWLQAFMAALRGDVTRARACGAVGWYVARRLIGQSQAMPLWLAAQAYANMARCYEWWAGWQRAIRYANKALAFYATNNDLNGIAISHATLGAAHYGLGSWEQALYHLGRSCSLAAEAGDPRLQGQALYGAALVYLERGKWTMVEENAQRIVAAAKSTGDVLRQGLGRLLLARISVCQGAPEQAVPDLQFLLQAARWSEASIFVVLTSRFLAEALLVAGEFGQAAVIAREGLELAHRSGQRREQGGLLRILGETLAQLGRRRNAEQHLREAISLAERIGCPYDLAQARCGLGRLYRAVGETEVAWEQLTAALALFENLGAGHDAEVIRQMLSHLASSWKL